MIISLYGLEDWILFRLPRKTVCEKISGRDCCRVPGPVLHCVHTAKTRLKPSTRNHSEVADTIRPTNITTTNISQYTVSYNNIVV